MMFSDFHFYSEVLGIQTAVYVLMPVNSRTSLTVFMESLPSIRIIDYDAREESSIILGNHRGI